MLIVLSCLVGLQTENIFILFLSLLIHLTWLILELLQQQQKFVPILLTARIYDSLKYYLLCAQIFILMHYRHLEFVGSLIVHISFILRNRCNFSYSPLSVLTSNCYYLFLILFCWFNLFIHIKLPLIKKVY